MQLRLGKVNYQVISVGIDRMSQWGELSICKFISIDPNKNRLTQVHHLISITLSIVNLTSTCWNSWTCREIFSVRLFQIGTCSHQVQYNFPTLHVVVCEHNLWQYGKPVLYVEFKPRILPWWVNLAHDLIALVLNYFSLERVEGYLNPFPALRANEQLCLYKNFANIVFSAKHCSLKKHKLMTLLPLIFVIMCRIALKKNNLPLWIFLIWLNFESLPLCYCKRDKRTASQVKPWWH